MKRISNIYDEIIDYDNIKLALYNSSKHKHHRKEVMRRVNKPEKTVNKILDIMKTDSFVPKYSKPKTINDGVKLKKRRVCEPKYFPDQIIQWAIYQVVSKYECPKIPQFACGSISRRGQVYAKRKVEKWINTDPKGMKYCIKLDIKKCYDSINHKILIKMLENKYKDKRFLSLMETLITSYHSNKGKHKGLAIGWVTSQLLSMIYLSKADNYLMHPNGKYKNDSSVYLSKEIRKHIKHRIRYMDDIYIFTDSKKCSHIIYKKFKTFIEKYMGLSFKNNYQIFRVYYYKRKENKMIGRKIDFVGYTMGFCSTGIRKTISLRIKRISNNIRKGNYSLHTCMAYNSYYGHLKHSASNEFFRSIYRFNINKKKITDVIYQASKRIYGLNIDFNELYKSIENKTRKHLSINYMINRFLAICD